MKIKLNAKRTEKTSLFYDEMINVASHGKKIAQNPNYKIITSTKETLKNISFCSLFLIILIGIQFYLRNKILTDCFWIIFLCNIFYIWYLIICKKNIKTFLKNSKECELEIDEKGIKLIEKDVQEIQTKWSNIRFIVVFEYGFYIIPKNNHGTVIGIENIAIDRENFFKGLVKYKKENLWIDNTDLYKNAEKKSK